MNRKLQRTLSAALVISLLTAGSVVLTPGIANAARTPSPGKTYIYGMPRTDFKANASSPGFGGYNEAPTWWSDGSTSNSSSAVGYSPVGCSLSEPYRSVGAATNTLFSVNVTSALLGQDDRTTLSAQCAYGAVTTQLAMVYTTVTCGATEWATTGKTWVFGNTGYSFGSGTKTATTPASDAAVSLSPANCPFVQGFAIVVGAYTYTGSPTTGVNGEGYWTATYLRWSAERYYTNTKYPPDKDLQEYCNSLPIAKAQVITMCQSIVGSDPSFYCAGGPTIDPIDGATYAEFFLYLGQCLFIPKSGWDREGLIQPAWDSSSAGDIGDGLGTIAHAFTFSAVCGNLFSTTKKFNAQLPAVGLVVDTCEWLSWSPPLRTAIGWIMQLAFAVWVVWFVSKTITGLLGGRMPLPVESESEEKK